jgi:hypothetical protein
MSYCNRLDDAVWAEVQGKARAAAGGVIEPLPLPEQVQPESAQAPGGRGICALVAALRKRLKAAHGTMPDSSVVIRSDRER